MLYLVSYDISDDKNRKRIIDKLDNMKAKKILKSQWIVVKKKTTAKNLRNTFRSFIDKKKDRLFVNSLEPCPSKLAWHRPKSGIRAFLVSRGIRQAQKGT